MNITSEQKHAIREIAEFAKMLEQTGDFTENRTIDDGYLDDGTIASLTIDALHEIASIDVESRPSLTEAELRETIKVAIGYDLVRLSIRDHPEITWEYRTAHDRDGLVDRISAALLPLTGGAS